MNKAWTVRHMLQHSLRLLMVTSAVLLLVNSVTWAEMPTLGGIVEAGVALKKGISKLTDPLSIARRVILQLGHEMDVKVEYQPEDAPKAIHMRHDPEEPHTERRIAIKTSLNYKYDIQSKIPGADVRKLVGFDFPNKGPADKVPVRIWFDDPSIFKYVQLRADNWQGLLPTWWVYTDPVGQATVYLYPLRDHRLGGVKKIASATVRVQAMVQLKEGIPTGWTELGALIIEEVASPTEQVVRVEIEYHEPTEWEGSVTVYRSIVSSSSSTGPEPTDQNPKRVVKKTANSLWEGVLEIKNLRLNTEGIGSGEYTYTIKGEGVHHTLTRVRTTCNDTPCVFNDTVDVNYNAEGIEYGSASVDIKVDPVGTPRYGIIVHAVGAGSSALVYPRLKMDAKQEHKWQDCNGEYSTDGQVFMAPESPVLAHLILPETIWIKNWPEFDYDASRYIDSVQWEETITNGSHSYTLYTTVEWDLRRVYK